MRQKRFYMRYMNIFNKQTYKTKLEEQMCMHLQVAISNQSHFYNILQVSTNESTKNNTDQTLNQICTKQQLIVSKED